MAKKAYIASDIETLENDRERMQKMSHLYIPDKRLAGCMHIIREIVDNSTDEVLNAGGTVDVYYDEVTREVKVVDTGRGMPQEKLQELCEVLHSSGKFSKGTENAYNVSGGLNGVGCKITNFLSDYFTVTSCRDGKSVTRKYEDGIFIKEKIEKIDKDVHGTTIIFKLSDKYLKETSKVSCKKIQAMIEEKTDCCEGLSITFHGFDKSGKKIKKKYSGLNIRDLMKKYMKPTSKIWEFSFKNNESTFDIAFGYDSKATESSDLMAWTNFIYNSDGGTHIDALIDELYEVFRKYAYKSFFSEKEKKNYQIRKEDIRLGLCGVIVLKTSKDPLYYGQFKQKVTAEWIHDELCEFLHKALNKLSDTDMKEISKIIRDNIKARLSSQKARQQVKKVGNGLSKDRIEKYIPVRMGVTTNYNEVYLTEGLSAGTQVEKARFDFQSIYMLRGKVDNIYDFSLTELSKIPIIQDLSRIFGLIPGKHGDILPDRIIGLTDADPDGRAIRAGIVVIVACAFPQIIEEGRLYMVEPPLFAFTENGKKQFVSTNREYLTYLQKKFAKNNDLYRGSNKMNDTQIFDFLLRNERYTEYLKKVADENICSMEFTELVISNLEKLGVEKESIPAWKKVIHNNFSKQLDVEWKEERIVISGIKNNRFEMIELDDDLLSSKKTKKLIQVMNSNLNVIYDYSINDKEKMSIYQVLSVFNSYRAKDLKRFKGLGEMSPHDLRETCMDLKNQKLVKITTKDIDKEVKNLAYWHSKKSEYRDFRRDFMTKYVPDIQDIST